MENQSTEQLEPSDFYSFFAAGIRECSRDGYRKAIDLFTKALESNPNESVHKDALYHRAYAWLAAGESHLARQDLRALSAVEDSDRVEKLNQLMGGNR